MVRALEKNKSIIANELNKSTNSIELNKNLSAVSLSVEGVCAPPVCLPVGGWVELGRTTLGSAGDNIQVSSLADKRYYMILGDYQASGNLSPFIRLGNSTVDSGTNYAWRSSYIGGADTTSISTSNGMVTGGLHNQPVPSFAVGYIANLSGNEKLFIDHAIGQGTAGAANAPTRRETVGKWANTSNPLDIVNTFNSAAGDYNTGSEVVVLGWDPADTHTGNFWEELASVDLSGGASATLSSGVFTSKKYLWCQLFWDTKSSSTDVRLRVGNTTVDTGSNYTDRASNNGGADGTNISQSSLGFEGSTNTNIGMANMFIFNNASNEKLAIMHTQYDVAALATNAPNRREAVWKWTNTSNQIDIIDAYVAAGTMGTNSIIKVWGSD